jgi:hypothetical protein
VLVGAHEPLPPFQETADGPLPSGLERDLAPLGIDGGSDLAALAVADDAALRSFAASARPMEEDRPTLEFSAPKSFLAGYSEEALRWAAAALPIEEIAAPARGEARRIRELLESFLDEARADWRAAARNYGERLRSGATADGGGL